jgi:hypothetical protein
MIRQRDDKHRLAADAVAVVTEDQSADGACGEADGERPERGERADSGLRLREEQLVEDERRRGPVQEEVVPLDRGTDEARQGDLAQRLGVALAFAAKALWG